MSQVEAGADVSLPEIPRRNVCCTGTHPFLGAKLLGYRE
jgi:hypothetical protein